VGEAEARDGAGVRLQVYMARSGLASRRAAEEIIAAGRVSVNGAAVSAQGLRVFPGDSVLMDGRPLLPERSLAYAALNKPPGFICSSSDPQGRPLALSLLPEAAGQRMFGVGRLDFMSCGLILFTNDGSFAARLGHPSCGVEKEYIVEATGHIPDEAIRAFESGIAIEGERYRAHSIGRIGSRCVRIVLIEGKNREIRRVFSHFHLRPLRLRRVRIGPVPLGGLAEGESRPLSPAEIAALLEGRNAPPGPAEAGRHPPHSPMPGQRRAGPNAPDPRGARGGAARRREPEPQKPRKELTW